MKTENHFKLIDLYRKISELTRPQCQLCAAPLSCCSPEYCRMASEVAREWGEALQPTGHATLPFMSAAGCVVPPHLRPLCTLHHCAINSLGFFPGQPMLTTAYYKLRSEIDDLEIELEK